MGKIILMKKPIPRYTRTTGQDIIRTKYKNGCDLWNALSSEDKQQWNSDAEPLRLTGFNYYMKVHMSRIITNLGASDDSYIVEYYPNGNYGSATYLELYDGVNWLIRTLLRFDISSIPAGSTIISAALRLFYYGEYGTAAPTKKIDVHLNSETWSEASVTWSNKPAYEASASDTIDLGDEGRWIQFDVTDDVQNILDGISDNYGWTIKFQTEPASPITEPGFFSKEESQLVPTLRVVYI